MVINRRQNKEFIQVNLIHIVIFYHDLRNVFKVFRVLQILQGLKVHLCFMSFDFDVLANGLTLLETERRAK